MRLSFVLCLLWVSIFLVSPMTGKIFAADVTSMTTPDSDKIIRNIDSEIITDDFVNRLRNEDPKFIEAFVDWLEKTNSFKDWYSNPKKLEAADEALKGKGKEEEGILNLWLELRYGTPISYTSGQPYIIPHKYVCASILNRYPSKCRPCKNPLCQKLLSHYRLCAEYNFPALTPICY